MQESEGSPKLPPEEAKTPSSETKTVCDDLEIIVDQMVEAELVNLRTLALNPDTAPVARLTMAMLKPMYLWILTEIRAGTKPEKMLGAVGQLFGNFAYLTALKTVQDHEQSRALRVILDTAMAKIGNRVKKSSIIIPGQA